MIKRKMMAIVASAALAVSLGLTACGGAQKSANNNAPASTESTTKTESSSSSFSTQSSGSTTEGTTTSQDSAAQGTAPATTAPTNSYIGDQAAVDAALAHAGLAASDVTQLEVKLDLDDATVHYDVDFKHNGMDYDYDIDATTGAIITAKSEVDD